MKEIKAKIISGSDPPLPLPPRYHKKGCQSQMRMARRVDVQSSKSFIFSNMKSSGMNIEATLGYILTIRTYLVRSKTLHLNELFTPPTATPTTTFLYQKFAQGDVIYIIFNWLQLNRIKTFSEKMLTHHVLERALNTFSFLVILFELYSHFHALQASNLMCFRAFIKRKYL